MTEQPAQWAVLARDLHEIRQLKYRYLRTLDLKQWEQFSDCFVANATGDYAGLVFGSRAELVAYMREHMGPGLLSLHQAHHPEIDVSGDRATGTWYLHDQVLVPDSGFWLQGAALYEDRYVRTEAGWRIAHTGYQRTFEVSMSTSDLASLKVRRGTAYGA